MTTDQILSAIRELSDKTDNSNVSVNQLSQLAAVVNSALKSIGIVNSKPQRAFRLALLGLVADREIKSSKELSPATAIALVSRWTQVDNPFQPSPECLSDVAVLVREVALREGQTELPL